MDFQAYQNLFNEILESPDPVKPYDEPAFIEYIQLNRSRMNRWLKKGQIDKELEELLKKIKRPQSWIIITEPWCGDAAHLVPFFHLMASLNPLIKVSYELRDAPPFRINDYLTDGKSRSIPILIVKDEKGKEIFHWGPRPVEAQKLHKNLVTKKAGFEEMKVTLQQWYNKDQGRSLQAELRALIVQSEV